jgi:hypothetical protein
VFVKSCGFSFAGVAADLARRSKILIAVASRAEAAVSAMAPVAALGQAGSLGLGRRPARGDRRVGSRISRRSAARSAASAAQWNGIDSLAPGLREKGRLSRPPLFAARTVIAVTALREALCLIPNFNGAGQRGVSEMSYHQGARIELRAHWLAIELVFYLLALLTLGAQFVCLLSFCPT